MARQPDDHTNAPFLTCSKCGTYYGDTGVCDCSGEKAITGNNIDLSKLPDEKSLGVTLSFGIISQSSLLPAIDGSALAYGVLITALSHVMANSPSRDDAQDTLNLAIKEAAELASIWRDDNE